MRCPNLDLYSGPMLAWVKAMCKPYVAKNYPNRGGIEFGRNRVDALNPHGVAKKAGADRN